MCSVPPESREFEFDEHRFGFQKPQRYDVDQTKSEKHRLLFWRRQKDDVELAISSTKSNTNAFPEEDNHYKMANDMINYQTIDVGQKCMC